MPREPTPPSQRTVSYPSDVSDEQWAFCAPNLCLMREDAPQRDHPLRELFNGLRYIVRAGCPWKMFEAMAHDLRAILRLAEVSGS